jgi:hypothetical protein
MRGKAVSKYLIEPNLSLITFKAAGVNNSSSTVTAITGMRPQEPSLYSSFLFGINRDILTSSIPISATTDVGEMTHRVVYGSHGNFVISLTIYTIRVGAMQPTVGYIFITPILRKLIP